MLLIEYLRIHCQIQHHEDQYIFNVCTFSVCLLDHVQFDRHTAMYTCVYMYMHTHILIFDTHPFTKHFKIC